MKQSVEYTVAYPYEGVNTNVDDLILSTSSIAMGVNVELKEGLLRTRGGFREIPLSSSVDEDLDWFKSENHQGSLVHNPSKGISGQVFSGDTTLILSAIGGKKFSLVISGTGDDTVCALTNVTNGLDQSKMTHMVFLQSAENYVLANDGVSNLWIWDTTNPAFMSSGYNSVAPHTNSKLPNGGTVLAYAHGRVLVVVDARKIIVGDIIHKNNLTSPVNILDTTEQVYWASGSFFMPPSSMGNIVAAAILPLKNTVHGHGEVIFHCEDGGQFSLDINIYPREAIGDIPGWDTREGMVKHAMLHTSARGPYCIAVVDGDQIFRSQRGIDSMISAAAESRFLGQPSGAVSNAMLEVFDGDYEPFLRFTSLVNYSRRNRIWCTNYPSVRGRFVSHDGIVSINTNPTGGLGSNPVFEGIHTLPYPIGEVVQLLNGRWLNKERLMAVVRSRADDPRDGVNKLVEYHPESTYDYFLNDNGLAQSVCIESQVIFRKVHYRSPFSSKELGVGKVYFRDIKGDMSFEVYIRTDTVDWMLWHSACINDVERCLYKESLYNKSFVCGEPPNEIAIRRHRWVQVLVKWKGKATLETFIAKTSGDITSSVPEEWLYDDRGSFVNTHYETDYVFNPYEYTRNEVP